MLMSIIITAAGLLGVLVSIVFIFFKVKEPIEITKKDTIYIIIWLILMTLGGVNLYFVYNNDNNRMETYYRGENEAMPYNTRQDFDCW